MPVRASDEAAFALAMQFLYPVEGGWYDGTHKRDPNPTNFGIIQRVYDRWRTKANLPRQSVKLLTRDEAREIYYRWYWRDGLCHLFDWPVALVHFDACVNHGRGNALWLQQLALNAFHYISLREAFYERIAERNPDQRDNLNGWRNRMRDLRKFINANPRVVP